MAKGRKLTTSRSELLLGSYGHGQGTGVTSDVSELGEEDVWSVVDGLSNSGDSSTNGGWDELAIADSHGSSKSIRSSRRIPRDGHRAQGGLSLAFDNSGNTASSRIVHQFHGQGSPEAAHPGGRHVASSAPVNVPDWSKIYRVDSVESLHDSDDGVDDGESNWVPPHEYLAREYARNRYSAANSVFEGVGRTLKGRDMSRVRDAVWSQTGFYG